MPIIQIFVRVFFCSKSLLRQLELFKSIWLSGLWPQRFKHTSFFVHAYWIRTYCILFIILRWKHTTPINTVVLFVPQQEAWVVERMGKFNKILEPGLNFLVPIMDKIKYVQSLKEIAIDVPQQSAITIGM